MTHRPRYGGYVLCATSRSGSTLLCRLLSATKVAGRPASYLHNPSVANWAAYIDLPWPETTPNRADMERLFHAIQTAGRGPTPVFGLRLMRKSFDFLMTRLTELRPDLKTDRAHLEATFGDLLYIHLRRDDKLAQAVSLVRAQQSGLWHQLADGRALEQKAPAASPGYDAAAILRHLDTLERDDMAWRDWFEDQGIAPLRLSYEQVAQDPAKAVHAILDTLYETRPDIAPPEPDVAKLADAETLRWFERFALDHPDRAISAKPGSIRDRGRDVSK
ncbi:MAG: Stf0 family sulfotransferase [Pseudomonadota bacterium]